MNLQAQPLFQRLVELRQKKQLSQRQLAANLKLPQSYLSNVENGKFDIRLGTFLELARYLGVEVMLVPVSLVPTVTALIEPDSEVAVGRKARWAVEYEGDE